MPVSRSSPRLFRLALLTILALFVAATASAVGPVMVNALPGGASVLDNDPGAGEQWGRAGGRLLTFTVNDPGDYTALTWGHVNGSQPHAAFDGSLNAAGETLTFNGSESNLSSGIAVWTGSAVITTANAGSFALSTRFKLTVTTTGAPVPITLSFQAGGVSPGILVPASGAFVARLQFEALYNGSWQPLLTLYDQLQTPSGPPPGSGGPVLTGFTHAFYYDSHTGGGDPGGGGLTLDEHDADIKDLLGDIEDDTDFLRIEVPGRFSNVQSKLNSMELRLFQIPTEITFPEFPEFPEFPLIPDNIATTDDVQSVQDGLSTTLLVLFGILPCPVEEVGEEFCETVLFVQDLATQQGLDALVEALGEVQDQLASSGAPIEVEILEVDSNSSKHRRWILKTSRNGVPVNADLTRIDAILTNKLLPAMVEDVTYKSNFAAIGPGLLDVMLEVSPSEKTSAYQFEVRWAGADASADGSALVASGNPGVGGAGN